MRTLLLSLFTVSAAFVASAQTTVATFDDLSLPKADTFYVNLTSLGKDAGFHDGSAYFPCEYDTSYGYTYFSGFAYSNMTDSTTTYFTFPSQYAAITGKGYSGSSNYAVAYINNTLNLPLTGTANEVSGFYITNSTYAYYAMAKDDGYGHKFGDTDGTKPDWFKLTVYGYQGGALKADSVVFYLADYRSSDTTKHYIVNTWQWVNLLPLGKVDSLQFSLSSSDTNVYGMVTPAYFCMDNLTTNNATAINNVAINATVKVYPNPTTDYLYIEQANDVLSQVNICDLSGRIINSFTVSGRSLKINTATLTAGQYILQLKGKEQQATVRFVKQ